MPAIMGKPRHNFGGMGGASGFPLSNHGHPFSIFMPLKIDAPSGCLTHTLASKCAVEEERRGEQQWRGIGGDVPDRRPAMHSIGQTDAGWCNLYRFDFVLTE